MIQALRLCGLGLIAAAALTACGGGNDAGDQTPRVAYGHLVSFGDSLSDVGSYKVSGVAAVGGGKFTVNGGDDRVWVERLAGQLGLPAPCAAQTGLNAIEAVVGFPPVPATNHAGCTAYGQGGARVTLPVGPGNVALFNPNDPGSYGNAVGALTDPIANQVARHLAASGGQFAADDLVTFLAGGNDSIMSVAVFGASVGAGMDPDVAAANAVAAVTTAANELVALIKNQVLAKGATRVLLINLPDLSQTPGYATQDPAVVGLVSQLVQTFNRTVASGLGSDERVLLVDAYTIDRDQNANPGQYALTNVTTMSCVPASSLTCTSATLVEGATPSYKYADSVHPTPYGHQLLTQLVALRMSQRGWL